MIEISEELKQRYRDDSVRKYLRIYIDGVGYIENDKIYYESFTLKESLIDGNWEYMGCIASEMTVKIQSDANFTKSDWKGTHVRADMACDMVDGSKSEYIPLFYGYIDTCQKDSDRLWQTITCYDAFYSKFTSSQLVVGGKNSTVYNWYSKYLGKTTKSLGAFREAFLELLKSNGLIKGYNLPRAGYLPNDNLKIKKRFKSKDMTILDIIQGLCQINGCFGRLNRLGELDFVYIYSNSVMNGYGAYPNAFYPNQVAPSQPYDYETYFGTEYVGHYRGIEYQDYLINPIAEGITIRNNTDDAGVTVTDDRYHTADFDSGEIDEPLIDDDDDISNGKYILQGNMFTYKLSKHNKQIVASNIIYANKTTAYFREYKAESNGLPYLECGDKVIYKNANGDLLEYVVLNRTLSGIQSMKDNYDSNTDADTHEYVTTSQKCVSNVNSSVSSDEATDIATEVTNEGISDALSSGNYMYVVSWDASTGILETSSGVANG